MKRKKKEMKPINVDEIYKRETRDLEDVEWQGKSSCL